MARKYQDEMQAAIKSLVRLKLNARQIRDRLAAGEAGLRPIEVPIRTVQHRAAQAKREIQQTEDPLENASEVDIANEILRDYLRLAIRKVSDYKALDKRGQLEGKHMAAMRESAKLISEIKRDFKRDQAPTRSTSRLSHAGQQQGRKAEPESMLQHLARTREPAFF